NQSHVFSCRQTFLQSTCDVCKNEERLANRASWLPNTRAVSRRASNKQANLLGRHDCARVLFFQASNADLLSGHSRQRASKYFQFGKPEYLIFGAKRSAKPIYPVVLEHLQGQIQYHLPEKHLLQPE